MCHCLFEVVVICAYHMISTQFVTWVNDASFMHNYLGRHIWGKLSIISWDYVVKFYCKTLLWCWFVSTFVKSPCKLYYVEHPNLRSVILDQQDKTIRPCDLIVGIRARIYLRLYFSRSVKKTNWLRIIQ